MVMAARKNVGMGKAAKRLTAKEKRTDEGAFAEHFVSLLNERQMTKDGFVEASGIKDATVRAWLRAESIPLSLPVLRIIAKTLGIADYRLVLPPEK